MQEPVKENVQEAASRGKGKPTFTIIVASVVAVVILAALGVAYGILSKSYNANLDKMKSLVAEAQSMYAGADAQTGTLANQAAYYKTLAATVADDCQILQKLNDRYPVLPGRASEQSIGLADLKAKMGKMAPQLDVLTAGIGEDASITSSLAAILGKGASEGQSSEYATLVASNDALAAKLSGISFEGKLEEGRAAMAAAVGKRSAVLKYLVDDSAINEEIAKLYADTKTAPADLKKSFEALTEKNKALEAEAQGVDLSGYGSGQVDIPGMISARKDLISASASYMGELAALQPAVAEFCTKVQGATVQTGKFTVTLASHMQWVKDLNDLQKQLDTIDAKAQYKAITAKRGLDTLGLTEAGQKLFQFGAALNAVNGAVTASNEIEKKIDSLIAEKKMDLPDKIGAIEALVAKNAAVLASLAVEAPEDLKAGLDSFKAACQERVTFLNEFMGYVEDQQVAAGCSATAGAYSKQRSEDISNANYWKAIEGEDGPTVKYYQQRAAEKTILINEQATLKNTANKNAAKHKTAYEASRKTYKPMLDA